METIQVSASRGTERRLRLGGLLVASGAITEEQLQTALAFQRKTNFRLGDALLQLDLVTEAAIKQAISAQLGIPFVDLESCGVDAGAGLASLLSQEYAQKHRVVPIARLGVSLTVAMDDPTDAAVIEKVRELTGCAVNVVTCTRRGLVRASRKVYGAETRDESRSAARDDPFWRG